MRVCASELKSTSEGGGADRDQPTPYCAESPVHPSNLGSWSEPKVDT